MDSRKAFELILLMAKTTTIAKTKNGQEAIEIAEDYMEYWGSTINVRAMYIKKDSIDE